MTRDSELADEVIAFDDDIDEVYLRTQQAIELLLARQTPVARDLRLVLAILHSNLHLERMGDLCTTIAKLTKLSADLPSDEGAARRVPRDGRARPGDDPRRAPGAALPRRGARESLIHLDELIDRSNRRVVSGSSSSGPRTSSGARAIVASLPRADRRPRGRHRRAGRLPRDRRVPRVHRRSHDPRPLGSGHHTATTSGWPSAHAGRPPRRSPGPGNRQRSWDTMKLSLGRGGVASPAGSPPASCSHRSPSGRRRCVTRRTT